MEGKAFTFKVSSEKNEKSFDFYLDSWVEVVERYEVTFLTDEDVVPHWSPTAGQVGGQVPGQEGEAQPGEAVQDRLTGVSRHPHGELHGQEWLGVFLVLLVRIDEVKVGGTVGKQGGSQPYVALFILYSLTFNHISTLYSGK